MNTTDDDATVIRASLVEPEDFGVLFDRHAPAIQRHLTRRLGREIADDLVAETFLAAFRKRRRYDFTRADARPWLYGIATKLISQHRRDEAKQYRIAAAVPAEFSEACHADLVAAQVTAQAMNSLLATGLAELSGGDRDVLLLIAWEGLAYDEVAVALGIPVGTVRSRLNRARKKVRAVLDVPAPTKTTEGIRSNG